MKFTSIDLFGVYVAPISLLMVAAWLILVQGPERRLLARLPVHGRGRL